MENNLLALAVEAAKTGVTVNAVCPGYTDTDIVAATVENITAKTGRTAEEARAELAERDAELASLRNVVVEPERIEVPVIPQSVTDSLAEMAARAEALASEIEDKAKDGAQ